MKKLYIGFILLFGFLTFVPQGVLADAISFSREEEKWWQEQKKATAKFEKSLQCLYEKKLKLPQEYSGPNLKVERVFYNGSDFSHKGNTGNEYIIEKTTKDIYNPIREGFIGRDCTEYIELLNNLWVYDVTNIPAGSHLKYIPATEEMEVLLPKDDSQKEFMAEQKERMRKSYEYREQKDRKKREERNKNVLLISIYTLCISIVLFILVRVLIRRTRKNKVTKF